MISLCLCGPLCLCGRSSPGNTHPRGTKIHKVTEKIFRLGIVITVSAVFSVGARAQTRITIAHNDNKSANPEFKFANVPSPSRDDAAAHARVFMVDGEADANGGDVSALTDGVLPNSADQPRRNFFVTAGSGGARVLIDLGKPMDVAAINSYSWHPNSRAPQVYRVWGSDGSDAKFLSEPKAKVDPGTAGWRVIATVDTRSPDEDHDGGQFGVSITDQKRSLGRIRYLLFDFYVTEVADNFGNTFYSEIDVIAK